VSDEGSSDPRIRRLNRGGLWVSTPAGPVQFGSPSETIKDTLRDADGVPDLFILGKRLFDDRRGLSFADIEFPIYFNLFARQRQLRIVTTEEKGERLKEAIKEALLGPERLFLEEDYADGWALPDLRREMEFFRKGPYKSGLLELEDALLVITYDDDGVAQLGDGLVARELDDGFSLEWPDSEPVLFPADPPLPPSRPEAHKENEPFVPPQLGITTLGRSHGFDPDPEERTSGFVLWVGGRGIMVDPPVHANDVLTASEIDQRHMAAILLTHCHADHDAGVLQKALTGGRVTLYTTPTVFRSYQRKWSLIAGIPEEEIEKLFDFVPVQVGAPMTLEGAEFLFRYTLHSIPTIGFEVHYGGRSFSYSSDTLNDPRHIERIYAQQGITPDRREELLEFDWGHDLIFHESGVPPLHTQLERLQRLPEDVQRRVVVVHINPHKLEGEQYLRVAVPGREGTIALNVEQTPEERVLRNLKLLGNIRLFAGLPLARAADLLASCERREVRAGETFIRQGEQGDELFIVAAGKAAVVRDHRELKVYGVGDYLGETAVFLGQARTADVVAKTNVEVLAFPGERMRSICECTDVPGIVARHAKVRDLDAWSLFDDTELFSDMTVAQKSDLEMALRPTEWTAGQRLYVPGEKVSELLLVRDGSLLVENGEEKTVERAAVVGDPAAILSGGRHSHAVSAATDGVGFALLASDLAWFLDDNPGVRVRVQPWAEVVETSSAAASLIDALEELM
jgi:CRP-like cAMP-binding protein/phosphoribosyl 1,2-cyclic phosphodiesterase